MKFQRINIFYVFLRLFAAISKVDKEKFFQYPFEMAPSFKKDQKKNLDQYALYIS